MSTVTIGAQDFEVYISVAEAETLLVPEIRLYPIWTAASADQKARGLVGATRWMNRQQYVGQATTDNEWPRTGVTDSLGKAWPDSPIPLGIRLANASLAALLIEDNSASEKSSDGVKTKYVKAGSVEVEFFAEAQDGMKFPGFVMEYVGRFLNNSSIAGLRAVRTGEVVCSDIPSGDSHGSSEGF